MKTTLLTSITLFLCAYICAQTSHNLDFEILNNDTAQGWSVFGNGDYKVNYDTSIVKSGSVSGAIQSTGESTNFKALAYTIPATFGGKKIKLSGYLKTENVVGFAGLWLRIDPQIAFDNMRSRKIDGTNDWKKYEIELELNNRSQQIVFGGLLSGSGKIWVDDFKITVDGKPLAKAPAKELDKAQKDEEFDSGSNISFGNLNTQDIENLDVLGRVWGFLKYYHPAIAKGNYNWDYELFRVLPAYQRAKTIEERDAILINWIDKLGEVAICKSCKPVAEDAFLKPDLDWMTSNLISKELSDKLQYIQKNRNQGYNYYVGMISGVGNPEFKNENPYTEMTYPDAGFRLLSVYRYWNIINYFFPNKHLIDKDWNSCLVEYIPKFINAENELEYETVALQMIADIKDTHANLWGGNDKIQELRGDYFAPVHVRFIENQLVVDNFFDEDKRKATKLEIGDVITHINGKLVDDLVEDMNPNYPASNQPTRLRNISFDMLRSKENSLELTVKRKETIMNLPIDLFNKSDLKGYYTWYPNRTERSFKKINNDIGYVTLQNINDQDINDLKEEFKDTKGVIIDIRNYPSTFVAFKLGNYLNSNRSEFVKFTQGSIDQPGEFIRRDGQKVGIKRGWSYKGQKVIVLVNELSQSQAEYTTMAFKAGDKTTIVGSTTAGADGNVSAIYLPGGLSTMISGIGVQYPNGKETQRIGIVPDVEVKPTIAGITEGRDEVLEKAIELINKNITKTETIKN